MSLKYEPASVPQHMRRSLRWRPFLQDYLERYRNLDFIENQRETTKTINKLPD